MRNSNCGEAHSHLFPYFVSHEFLFGFGNFLKMFRKSEIASQNVKKFIFFWCVFRALQPSTAAPSLLRIGAVFSPEESEERLSFKIGVEKLNSDLSLLPETKLIADVEFAQEWDSFSAGRSACTLIKRSVVSIFGPSSGEYSASHVKSICDHLDIPLIETRWTTLANEELRGINLFPHFTTLTLAYFDLMMELKWEKFAFVYDDNEDVIVLREFYKLIEEYESERSNSNESKVMSITPYQLWSEETNYRRIFQTLKSEQHNRILLHIRHSNLQTALTQDFHTMDLQDFQYAGTEIFAFRITDPKNPNLLNLLHDWSFHVANFGETSLHPPTNIKTSTALIFDAVKLFAGGLDELDKSQLIETPNVTCDGQNSWSQGTSLVNSIRNINMLGVTGHVSFNQLSRRTMITLYLTRLTSSGLENIGNWTDVDEQRLKTRKSALYKGSPKSKNLLDGHTFVVSTVLTKPFNMLKDTPQVMHGNDRYEGFAIDLLEELSSYLGFRYNIQLNADQKQGEIDPKTNQWNGIIGDIVRGHADIGLSDITLNKARQEVVEFSHPFMTTGIGILYKKAAKSDTQLFAFFNPFSPVVYLYTGLAFLGVSLILFLVGRLSPYEWRTPLPCEGQQNVTQNELSLKNSLWFTLSGLMQQGSEIAPKAISTRTIAGLWYFFTLIMVSSYTANLAAFLTVEVTHYPFSDAKSLVNQTNIKYGCLQGGSTCDFFRKSNDPVYQAMWELMEKQPEVFPESADHGIAKVLHGRYAFFMETAGIEYHIQRNCNLTQIGAKLDSKSYGLALPKGSPLIKPFSEGILFLEESGRLHELYDKWWKHRKGGGACYHKRRTSAIPELTMHNLGGIFLLLLTGFVLSFSLAIVELAYFLWKLEPDNLKEALKEELKFAFDFRIQRRPVRRQKCDQSIERAI